MTKTDPRTAAFEVHRPRLRAAAYRMLGSVAEAEDAVQEAWLNYSKADTSAVQNLGAWLTTVVARVCLNQLRSRRSHPEQQAGLRLPDPIVIDPGAPDPQDEVMVADSVGLAMLVVLETLNPAERVAFVLHDVFGMPFEQIGGIVDRSPSAARQLASRARRRVRASGEPLDRDLAQERAAVDAFLAAARAGDLRALLRVLHPDVVLRADLGPGRASREIRGAGAAAEQALSFAPLGRYAHRVMVNGAPGLVVTLPDGSPFAVLAATVRDGRITELDIISDPARLRDLSIGGGKTDGGS